MNGILFMYLNFRILSGLNTKIFHVKMLNNEKIVPFPHYLVVHHCNANDLEVGEILIVHL